MEKMITLPRELLERLVEAAGYYCDRGPPGEGWKSAELLKTIAEGEALLNEP